MFIGVRIPLVIAQETEAVHEAIEPFFEGSFTDAENLHVTLKSLGSITDSTASKVKRTLLELEIERTRLSIEGFGSFSNRIIWARVSGLDEVQRSVDAALEGLFEPENRFMSHLTIARIRTCNEPGLSAALKALHLPLGWYLEGIELIESTSDENKAQYETKARYLAKAYRSL